MVVVRIIVFFSMLASDVGPGMLTPFLVSVDVDSRSLACLCRVILLHNGSARYCLLDVF